jgi:hypothetical protein
MKLLPRTADDLIGAYRTFGAEGPPYQVVSKRDGQTVRVRVLESGEEVDYPVQQALADPEAE